MLGSLCHFLTKKRRIIVAHNLKIVHPEMSDEEIKKLTKKVFRYSFANLTSAINTSAISLKRLKKTVSIHGQENFSELPDEQGAIFMLFHMGNWEALGRIAPLLNTDKPTAAMYRPLKNGFIDDHVRKKREREGTKLFSRKKGLIEANKFLRNGNILGILSDQHSGNAGFHHPLFGLESSITPLPALLAVKHGCPVIPVSLITEKPGKWKIEYHSPINIPKGTSKEEGTKMLIPAMEKIMREHSLDIFWLHDRWKIKHQLKEDGII